MDENSFWLQVKAFFARFHLISIILVIILVTILYVVSFFIARYSQNHRVRDISKEVVTVASSTEGTLPSKKEYGTVTPPSFPSTIPLEKNSALSQSYELEYGSQKQFTIVFNSPKTVEENYILYLDFLNKQKWNILNNYNNTNMASIYMSKENNQINLTISKNSASSSTQSQVSISILKIN